jgi:N-acetylneuraminic acid mutarotase
MTRRLSFPARRCSSATRSPSCTDAREPTAVAIKKAEVYTPTANVWTALSDLPMDLATHSVTVLPSGQAVVAGGANGNISAPVPVDLLLAFDPANNTFAPLGNLRTARGGHGAAVTADGLLVVFGGNTTTSSLASLEAIHR